MISSTYIDTVSVKENQKGEETELSLARIPGPISTCQAQLAFEAYAFILLNFYRHDTVSVKENQKEEETETITG